ncbi:fructose repressor FruR LacI family [Vibrio variabilis]|uniref:Fructose repressor FruR LacI family n=1 Tax=Vibrio variabilis TaxID=990271 RepID=A0ABQ0JJM0_9VIBR|nr:fructose repressor FruR LacI family [Vibrio variabilis]
MADALISRRIDALFVASAIADASDYYLSIQQRGTPVIAIDRSLDDEHFSCVISEDHGAAYDLTQSVIDEQVETIGLIGALPDLNISRERQLGFETAVKEKQLASQVAYGDHFNSDEGKRVLMEWIEQGQLPDALVTTSYTLLEGVLDVLIEKPELMGKIKIGTFGDNRLLDFLPLRVNSLPQQFELICDSALELALNGSAKRYKPGVELIPRKLKIR